MKRLIELAVNGETYEITVEPSKTLLDVLREDLNLTGTKKGCDRGECGACTVLLDGKAVSSCLTLAVQAQGKKILTIEGLADNGKVHPLQQAFVEHNAIQCGYCTPGMILSAKALLDENPNPTEEDVKTALSGNLCRCTGYVRIIQAVLAAAGSKKSKEAQEYGADYVIVGKSPPRVDAVNKATGKALFGVDIKLPNMLYGKILRSKYPHARVITIDVSKAQKLRGVKAVITARDVPDVKFGMNIVDQSVLANDKVRFMGDAIAAVAAVDEDTAQEALELIIVECEELPAIFDPEEAIKPEAPLIHEDLDKYARIPVYGDQDFQPIKNTNIPYSFKVRRGDVEKGFRQADFVFEDTFTTQMLEHCSMETHVAVANIDSNEGITVWTSNNTPFLTRPGIAQVLQVPENKIRIIVPYVGGSFGGKESIEFPSMACLLAQKTNRPVKMVMTREEEFTASTVTHPTVIKIKTGVMKNSTMIARQAHIIWDKGAYLDSGVYTCNKGSYGATGPYKIPNIKIDAYSVYTNKHVSGAFRGFGMPQVTWACESQIDIIAHKLGLDPLEMRLINAAEEGTISPTGEALHDIALKKLLQKTTDRLNWGLKIKGKNRGRGIACGWKSTEPRTSSGAFVKVDVTGTIQLLVSAVEQGQGIHTILSQIAAEEMGVPLEDVKITHTDTDVTPYDFGQISSRSTFNLGNSVKQAVADAKRQVLELAAERFGASVDALDIKNGQVYVKRDPEQMISMAEIGLFSHYMKGGPILGRGSFMLDTTIPPPSDTGQSKKPTDFWMYACHAAEVEVNTETGQVKVIKFVAAHDVGKAIHPACCEGQIEGSVAMGLGSTLTEEILLEKGNTLNPTLLDYKIFGALDMPEIETIIVEEPHRDGPYEAIGIGEVGLIATAPAIANAVFDAVGVRIKDLPITPDKILKALKEKREH
ncbi:molybdopterin-dependent oxidoreductase [Chloroflexota bacterium]